jgi:glutaredoxin 3
MKQMVEIFTAGCSICIDLVDRVRAAACPACDVRVLDMGNPATEARAREIGVRLIPAIVVDGQLVEPHPRHGYDDSIITATCTCLV